MITCSVIRGGLRTTLALAGVLSATAAFAQETTTVAVPGAAPANTSTASAAKTDQIWLEKLKITYIGVFDGPPISALDSNFRTNQQTGFLDQGTTVGFRNDLAVIYPINDAWSFGPVFRFKIKAVPEGDNSIIDPYIKLANGKLYTNGNFSIKGQIRWGFPWSDSSKKVDKAGYLATKFNFGYDVPNSKFSLGFEAYDRANFYKNHGGMNNPTGKVQKDLEMSYIPSVNFQWLPTLAITAGYEMDVGHQVGQALLSSYDNAGTYFEPGLSWDITPSFNVSPYVDIYTGDRIAPDTTLAGVGVTWKIM